MTIRQVASALRMAYNGLALGIPTASENVEFTQPSSGRWASTYNVPADLYANSLGDGGMNRYIGFYQINLHVPEDEGTAQLYTWADTIINYFRPGRRLVYAGQEVQITRSVPSPIGKSEQSAGSVMSVSIYWMADMARSGAPGTAPDPIPGGSPGHEIDYEFIQSTPSDLWVINHNLNRKVTTDVYTMGGVKIWADILNVNDNTVHVILDTPATGYAIIN